MQTPKEKVSEFENKLEYKIHLLQEKCLGRYRSETLKEQLFHGMTDKLRDSVRYLYSQPDCNFNRLLKAAMMCEFETASRASTRAKSLQVNNNSEVSGESSDIISIRNQLEKMSTILKSANFKGSYKSSSKNNKQNGKDQSTVKDGQQGLKGPGVSVAGPFNNGRCPVQCHCCCGWGHYRQ